MLVTQYNFFVTQESREVILYPKSLKQELALGEQNVRTACPKDKLEFSFVLFWALLCPAKSYTLEYHG